MRILIYIFLQHIYLTSFLYLRYNSSLLLEQVTNVISIFMYNFPNAYEK